MKGFFVLSIIVIIAAGLVLWLMPPAPTTSVVNETTSLLSTTIVEEPAQADAQATALIVEEVRLHEVGFAPSVYRVQAGEPFELVFLFQGKEFVTIEEAGIAEYVQAGTLQVTLDHPGEYDLVCLSCDDPYLATISAK